MLEDPRHRDRVRVPRRGNYGKRPYFRYDPPNIKGTLIAMFKRTVWPSARIWMKSSSKADRDGSWILNSPSEMKRNGPQPQLSISSQTESLIFVSN